SIAILRGIRHLYEDHHKVNITDDAIESSVRLSERFVSDRFLPDKAIDLIDEAGAMVNLAEYIKPQAIIDLEVELSDKEVAKEAAIAGQEFELAAELRDSIRNLKIELKERVKAWQKKRDEDRPHVSAKEISSVISRITGIPLQDLKKEDAKRLTEMESEIERFLVGQHEAVKAVADAIRRNRAGFSNPNRPTGSFLFLGPSGVGKTELARVLATHLFGSEKSIIRLDMSEYMERHAVSRLIGAPPGYVGFEEGGQLTERIRRRPFSVILLDEIEKAHQDVFNILLQIMDDGRLTDSKGRLVDFRHAIIIMTSNVGTQWKGAKSLGFSSSEQMDDKLEGNRLDDAIKKIFRPEFLGRLDQVVHFSSLNKEQLGQIAVLLIERLSENLVDEGLKVELTPEAIKALVDKSFDPKLGARPLVRAIQNMIEDPIAEKTLAGEFMSGDTIKVDKKEDEFFLSKA
ncbi:MAG: ATP-dependent Clp protease ATP-binding subunit, partial [Caldisericia bacterium]|nr:ATP-dependent Clp protease ATP-binding subunit [Caldisericia bacterium]